MTLPAVADDPKRAALLREIEAEKEGKLEPWQEQFANWLAMHRYAKVERQCDAASTLAGYVVSRDELRRLKQRQAYKNLWYSITNLGDDINEARVRFGKRLRKAADVYGKTLDVLSEELDNENGDRMGAVRAAAPLVIPALDRAIPKNPEQIVAPVVITLTPQQTAALNQPELIVTAVEVVDEESTQQWPRIS